MARSTLLVPAVALAVTTTGIVAHAAPLVGPEYELEAPFLTLGPSQPRSQPRVAWNGSQYLVVFVAEGHVRARRVSAAGQVLDASDIDLGPWTTTLNDLDVAADGNGFVVLWNHAQTMA